MDVFFSTSSLNPCYYVCMETRALEDCPNMEDLSESKFAPSHSRGSASMVQRSVGNPHKVHCFIVSVAAYFH